jgi:hypothetical protein
MAVTTLFLNMPAGQAVSDPLEIPPNFKITRIGTPSAWDSAPLTFLFAPDADV